jgi:hypothetical protein
LFADRIQNPQSIVPTATAMADSVCSHGITRFQPNSSTPRNVASLEEEGDQNLIADHWLDDISQHG